MGRFKEELGLSDEQMEKFKALQDEMRQQMQDVRRQMREGTLDRDKMRETFEKARDGMQAKIDEILTPEQREKFKGMRENMRGRFGDRRRGPNREELGRRLREEAVKALALGEEEQAVVLPLLDTVLETRKLVMQEQARRRDAFLESVRSTTDAGALTQLLTDYRAAREADKAQVTQAQAQLREVLTVEQEAKLVGLNILD